MHSRLPLSPLHCPAVGRRSVAAFSPWARHAGLLACALASTGIGPTAQAAQVTLDFNSLPSAQGWSYMAFGNSAPESQVFSVSGGVLTQNSLGLGSAAQGSNRYNLFDVLDVGWDTTLEVTAQLYSSELDTSTNRWGFGAGWFDGTGHAFGFSLANDGVQTTWGYLPGVNTLVQHSYRLVGHAAPSGQAAWAELWVDGALIGSGAASDYGDCAPLAGLCNSINLGDGTGGPNAAGVYLSFQLTQTAPVPEPGTAWLALAGLLPWLGRRQRAIELPAA
jgi:hypothetical protein